MNTPPSVRAVRRRLLLAVFVPTALCAALALYPPAWLARANFSVDHALLRFAGTEPPDGRVVIVDVDDRSLSTIGQWPWRRDVVGELIERLRAMGARIIALDIIFSEPDRGEGAAGTAVLERQPDDTGRSLSTPPDAALAEALRGGRAVVGYAFTFGDAASGSRRCNLTRLLSPSCSPPAWSGTLLSSAPPMRFAVCRALLRLPARPDSSTRLPTATAS